MYLIHKIYNKLSAFFKPKITSIAKKESTHKPDEYLGGISFMLTQDLDIDIMCSIPEIEHLSIDELSELSEKYAKFLCYINDGELSNDIIGVLDQEKNSIESEKNILFLNNVLFFWALTHVENQKAIKKNEKSGQPMIRPMDVFRTE